MKKQTLLRSPLCFLLSATAGSTLLPPTAQADLTLQAPVKSPGIYQKNPLATDLAAPTPNHKNSQTVTRQEFSQALIHQMPLLARLQLWRDTARGRAPQQEWQFFSSSTPLRVVAGKQALPGQALLGASGTAPALGAQWGRVAVGSTSPLLALNQSLQDVDELMGEKPSATRDESQLTWLSAQPLQSQRADLNVLWATGQRDRTPNQSENKHLVKGAWTGASGRLALSPEWKLSGEWMSSRLREGANADAWQMNLGGPISHPWGIARFDAAYQDRQAGFANWRDGREQTGLTEREVSLRQDLNLGDITGSTRMALQQSIWLGDVESESVADDPANTLLEGSARLRWKLTPSLALTGAHVRREAWRQLPELAYAEWDGDKVEAARSESEAGAELKLSSSLALTASAGITRTDGEVPWSERDAYQPFDLRDEERFSVGLRHKTKQGAWQLQVVRGEIADPFTDDITTETGALRLEAERQLLPWLRLKGRFDRDEEWNMAQLAELDKWRRQAEAELSLSELGRLSLRYGDQLRYDGTAMSAAEIAAKEYGVRYQIGEGSGLNLSVEYSRRLQTTARDDEQWRVGLTYR